MHGYKWRAESIETGNTLYLLNATPDQDDNVFTDLTEASNYDGEITVSRISTDWDVWTESDASDYASVQMKDQTFTASGGTCTTTHSGLLDNNATEASRQIEAFFDHGATQNIPDASTLTLQDLELRGSTV